MDSAVLLVARNDLDRLAFAVIEDDEIADDVDERCGPQHPGHQELLAVQRVDSKGLRNVCAGERAGVLPLEVMLVARGDAGDSRLVEESRDEQLVVVEEALDALVLFLFEPVTLV